MHRISVATQIILTDAERVELEGLVRSTRTEHRLRQRARIVLLAAEGTATRAIGRKVGCTTGTASKWRVRYAEWRLAGLDETGNRGNTRKYTIDATRRILRVLDLRLPDGYGRWTGPLIAKALGDVDVQHVWRVLRAQKIDLSARKSWCESNDPEFAAKAAGCGRASDHGASSRRTAMAGSVDEKPDRIQALDDKQGSLEMPNGRALTRESHDYKLMAQPRCSRPSNLAKFPPFCPWQRTSSTVVSPRRGILGFMLNIVAEVPVAKRLREGHVFPDNPLNTYMHENDRWPAPYARLGFGDLPYDFTSDQAVLAQQIEIVLGPADHVLTGTSFSSSQRADRLTSSASSPATTTTPIPVRMDH